MLMLSFFLSIIVIVAFALISNRLRLDAEAEEEKAETNQTTVDRIRYKMKIGHGMISLGLIALYITSAMINLALFWVVFALTVASVLVGVIVHAVGIAYDMRR